MYGVKNTGINNSEKYLYKQFHGKNEVIGQKNNCFGTRCVYS